MIMVCDLWVQRLESREVSSITGISFEPEIFNYPT
jgi:hypothetical protein